MNGMKKSVALLLVLLQILAALPALAEPEDVLGKPFPDFSVQTTDGETFTLSEALKDHQAVLINLFATWCPPCRMEFPDLDAVAGHLNGRLAAVALSLEEQDTRDVLARYREELGLSALPVGRDEDWKLTQYVDSMYIPVTVLVDRFGNAVYAKVGAFQNQSELLRPLAVLLSDDYTESRVLAEPADVTLYALRIVDQNGDPVPGMYVNFCTDTFCQPCRSGEDGLILFSAAPAVYHMQPLKAPAGYSFRAEDDAYTERDGGLMTLTVQRD